MAMFFAVAIGLCLIAASAFGIVFASALGGLGTGPKSSDYFLSGLIACGVLAPPFILGTHYALFRWIMDPSSDYYLVLLMVAFVVVGVLAIWLIVPWSNDLSFPLGYTAAAAVAFLLCAGMMQIGRG